jgi:dCMP deaminase
MDREKKYELTIHAETNAIITAAIHGVSTDGCSAYVTMHPCSRCSAALINAGIKNVYVKGCKDIPERWLENFILASKLLEEAGIPLVAVDL